MRGEEYGVRHLTVDRTSSLEVFLSQLVPLERARELLTLGSIYVNGERATDASRTVIPADQIRAHLEPRRFAKTNPLKTRIVEENAEALVVDKPAGLPVHALVDNSQENLISFLETELGMKLLVTHRLDVDTCGLVVLAKTVEAQRRFNEAFRTRTLKRSYIAVAEQAVPLGTAVHYMEQSPKAPKVVHLEDVEGRLRCELEVTAIRPLAASKGVLKSTAGREWRYDGEFPSNMYEIEIELKTGRSHQIRAQMAALGAPLLGDTQYGSRARLRDADTNAVAIALWAFRIQTVGNEKILRAGKSVLS